MISRWIDAIALLGLWIFVSYLSGTGQTSLLINPHYHLIVSFASACLILAAGWLLLKSRSLQHMSSHTFSAVVIISTVIMGFQLPLQSLSSETALSRGVETRVPSFDEIKFQEAMNTPSGERTLIQWSRILTQHPDPRIFIGQKVRLEGMVVKPEKSEENTLLLIRFVVGCCIADARPLGLLIDTSDADQWENNEWIAVNGTISLKEYDGQARGVVHAQTVELISKPKNPYEFEY
ncbi:MAG: TIGR03943 family protein [Candidatus Altimarinota bacterium]